VNAGLVVKLNRHADEGSAFRGEVAIELSQRLERDTGAGHDCSTGWFAKLRFGTTNNRGDVRARAKVLEEVFAAGGLSEAEEGAGVDGAEMVEIVCPGRKSKQASGIGRSFDSNEIIEWELGDALHNLESNSVAMMPFMAARGSAVFS
jgi:hypothetical protein